MPESQVEPLMRAAESGERAAGEQLFASLYEELRRLAQRELRRPGPSVTLSATTLLHELYIDLCGRQGAVFTDRMRFLAYAARAMRGLVIDYARSRRALKRGAAFENHIAPG